MSRKLITNQLKTILNIDEIKAKEYETLIYNILKNNVKKEDLNEEYANFSYEIIGEIKYLINLHNNNLSKIENFLNNLKYPNLDFPSFEEFKQKQKVENDMFLNPPNVKEGFYECDKCKCKKTYLFQLQLRGLDEPATTFITCMKCGNKWKFN